MFLYDVYSNYIASSYCLVTVRNAILTPDSVDSEVSARHPILAFLGARGAAEVSGGTVGEGVRLSVVNAS